MLAKVARLATVDRTFRKTERFFGFDPTKTAHPIAMMVAFFNCFSFCWLLFVPGRLVAQAPELTSKASIESRVAGLVAQLSDPNYASRLNAQAELERIGVMALDQLHTASFHPDPQIASTARYIVQSNQFSWAWETDSVKVRQILTNYGNSPLSEKSTCIDSLRLLEHDEGFTALCRLVRYETQSSLAKRAALLLMRSKPTVDQTIATRKAALLDCVAGGQSQASIWVQKYAENSNGNDPNQFDLAWWENALQNELDSLRRNAGETNLEIASDLNKWIIEQISTGASSDDPAVKVVASRREQAIKMGQALLSIGTAVPTLDMVTGNKVSKAEEFAQWALKFNMPELVQTQHGMLPEIVLKTELKFCYYLAESFLVQGKPELANEIAERARKQLASNAEGQELIGGELNSKKRDRFGSGLDLDFDRQPIRSLQRRWVLADLLRKRGQFAWAEAEYRLALYQDEDYRSKGSKVGKPEDPEDETPVKKELLLDLTLDVNIRLLASLADMLHSQSRFGDAADTLEPFVLRFEKEPMFNRQLLESSPFASITLSNYYLYRGDEARELKEVDKAKEHYWKSINKSPDNVDALIGLYRLDLPESDVQLRRAKLKEIIANQRTEIRTNEENLKSSDSRMHAYFVEKLATDCNTLAWIIANTEGSSEEAIFLSRRACRLNPESAELLDTLAHCYASMGKFKDAVQQQRRAIELKPHHPTLKRALEKFEESLRDASNSKK